MSEEIEEAVLLREYCRELRSRNAAVFVGAGLSMPSGYVDWRTLLEDIIEDLGLDPNKEQDLVTIAQYHCNQAKGNRARLTQTILNYFGTTKKPTENHQILASLPIQTYWTTNYDKLIERSLETGKKVPDVKYTIKQLAATRPHRDVTVYKMHGDVDHPAEAVINRDDYEAYGSRMEPFVSALRGDLVEKTFLFLGFSFSDPNIDYILSRVRVQYEGDQRHHYNIQKRVTRIKGESKKDFERREIKQGYFIGDLKRFGIFTVLVDEYSDITDLLHRLSEGYKRSSIFISGAADDYGAWRRADADKFLHDLAMKLATKGNRIITGFGAGVGSAVLNGTLAFLDSEDRTASDDELMLRPFPQIAAGGKSLATRWTEYRTEMIEHAGIAIFVFGNRRDSGGLILSNGVREEFELCAKAGVKLIPVGSTGFMAKELWKEVFADFSKFFPDAPASVKKDFTKLGNTRATPSELGTCILRIAEYLQRSA